MFHWCAFINVTPHGSEQTPSSVNKMLNWIVYGSTNNVFQTLLKSYVTSLPSSNYQGHSMTLHWRHDERDAVSNHQPHDCLPNVYSGPDEKENIKAPRHWPLCGDRWIPRTMASNAENVSIWWRHHEKDPLWLLVVDIQYCSLTLSHRFYHALGIRNMLIFEPYRRSPDTFDLN